MLMSTFVLKKACYLQELNFAQNLKTTQRNRVKFVQ